MRNPPHPRVTGSQTSRKSKLGSWDCPVQVPKVHSSPSKDIDMAGILPSTPEAARAEIERLLANVPGLDLSIHQELLASDGLSQIVHMTNGNWTEVRVHGRLNGFPASAFLLALEDEELGRHLLMRAVEAVAEQARTPGERRAWTPWLRRLKEGTRITSVSC